MSKTKPQRRIRNWAEYNQALISRGDFSVWLPKKAVKFWCGSKRKKLGRPQIYADAAIECVLTIRAVYRLSLRATQGLLAGLIRDLNLNIPCPNYTTLCRRAKSIQISPKVRQPGPLQLVFDASGLKVYGSGEWRQLKKMIAKRRGWRKIHIGLDAVTQRVVVLGVSGKEMGDGQMLPNLLGIVKDEVDEVLGDGAYDTFECYQAIQAKGALAVIPPRKGARLRDDLALASRNDAIHRIWHQKRGKRRWKEEVGYHRRSLVETLFSRWKGILGPDLRSRRPDTQQTECVIKAAILNKMADLGMPERERMVA